jgi:flavin reductase (DIM6/NTAB) family NADH-FMN oxidoreductase RutF
VRADQSARPEASFDEQAFREALGCFATGVTVITTQGVTHPYGMTANAFSSVSLDPPLVLVCVESGREGSRSIQANGVFAVNVLATHQESLSRFFASVERPRGSKGFTGIPYGVDKTGSPVLEDIVGHFDCHLVAAYEAGDHIIFIGQVLSLGMDPDREPLLFHRGRYTSMPEQPT